MDLSAVPRLRTRGSDLSEVDVDIHMETPYEMLFPTEEKVFDLKSDG